MSTLGASSVEAALAGARTALGFDADMPVRTWRVARMHSGGRDFLLAAFGPPEHTTGLAAVDPISGEVLESARLPGSQGHSLITADEAALRAGIGPVAQARLVWDPSPASRSRFYPLWQLRNAERELWVDSVRGVVWNTLDATRGGGSSPP